MNSPTNRWKSTQEPDQSEVTLKKLSNLESIKPLKLLCQVEQYKKFTLKVKYTTKKFDNKKGIFDGICFIARSLYLFQHSNDEERIGQFSSYLLITSFFVCLDICSHLISIRLVLSRKDLFYCWVYKNWTPPQAFKKLVLFWTSKASKAKSL